MKKFFGFLIPNILIPYFIYNSVRLSEVRLCSYASSSYKYRCALFDLIENIGLKLRRVVCYFSLAYNLSLLYDAGRIILKII